ncbi:MAG: phosphoribosyltransferase [Nitrososphaerota archaeon]
MGLITVDGEKYLPLEWSDIERLVDGLVGRLSGEYNPDTIVGVMRGGAVVANLISDLLGLREVYLVGCRSYEGLESGVVRIYHDLYLKDLAGRRVVLVDDVSDTGNTLSTAVAQIIRPRNPLELRTATLLMKPWTSFRPDYYADTTDAWVIFPWERMETVRLLGGRFNRRLGRAKAVETLSKLSRLSEDKVLKALVEVGV